MFVTYVRGPLWLLLTFLAIPVRAQVPAASPGGPPDSTRLAAAHRVLDASGAAALMISAIKANIPAQRAAMPQVPAEFWTRFEERLVLEAPQLVDSIAVVYAGAFSLQELQQLTAFYESPIGRRFRDAQPALVTQTSAIGQRWGMRVGTEVGASLPH